jgi:Zn-dependent protease with chaperone function
MSDVQAFFAACLLKPELLTAACALVLVPPLAWLVVRALAPTIHAMESDRAWQAPLAAFAATLPALLFVAIGLVTVRDAWGSPCLNYLTGRILYAGIAAVTVFGLFRATIQLHRRWAEVRRLLALTRPASPLLASLKATRERTARELDSDDAFILLAGIVDPVVIVSSEALRRLDGDQLEAAIRHEIAHARRGDQIISAIVSFIADIVPLPVGGLVALYRRAREFAADAHAVRHVDPVDLAGALIALARGGASLAGTAAFAEPGTVRGRLAILLDDAPTVSSRWRRVFVTGVLCTTFVLGASPSIAAFASGVHCLTPTLDRRMK